MQLEDHADNDINKFYIKLNPKTIEQYPTDCRLDVNVVLLHTKAEANVNAAGCPI